MMIRAIFIPMLFFLTFGCKPKDEVISEDTSIRLRFSKNEVLFDTLFTSVGSTTQWIKVYNDSKNAVQATFLMHGNSKDNYSLIVNGSELSASKSHIVYGKDSLYILVKVQIDPANASNPFLVTDTLYIDVNGNRQKVSLVAWGQDAHFIKTGTELCNQTWDSTKPYVIKGNVKVAKSCSLRLDKGTRLYFDKGAKLTVDGTLLVDGTLDSKVYFGNANDVSLRPSRSYGYWEGIVFTSNSTSNQLNHAVIANATNALKVEWSGSLPSSSVLDVSNSMIQFVEERAIWALGSHIKIQNSAVFNAMGGALRMDGGGKAIVQHCTFAAYGTDLPRGGKAFDVSNSYVDHVNTINEVLEVFVWNSIVWGSLTDEWPSIDSGIEAKGNCIRTQRNFSGDNFLYSGNDRGSIAFVNDVGGDVRLKSSSPAVNKGVVELSLPKDITQKDRSGIPDAGCYEY